jgi:hypothetical protein
MFVVAAAAFVEYGVAPTAGYEVAVHGEGRDERAREREGDASPE